MISINLLPEEILAAEKQISQKSRINKLTILILTVMVVITGGVLVYSFFKTQETKNLQKDLLAAEGRVGSYKSQEGYLSLIKQRILNIKNIRSNKNKEVESFNLVDKLIPNEIKVTQMQIDKDGIVSIAGETFSPAFISKLLDDFLDRSKNNSKINSLKVNAISRSPLGGFKFDVSTKVE